MTKPSQGMPFMSADVRRLHSASRKSIEFGTRGKTPANSTYDISEVEDLVFVASEEVSIAVAELEFFSRTSVCRSQRNGNEHPVCAVCQSSVGANGIIIISRGAHAEATGCAASWTAATSRWNQTDCRRF
jgi:hypothetical protein